VKGCKRFLDRVWNLASTPLAGDAHAPENEVILHQTIKKVGEDIDLMKFNTAIAQLMTLANTFSETKPSRGDIQTFLTLLSPFAPHIAEELWETQGFDGSAMSAPWPDYDPAKLVAAEKEIAVQVGGKLRGTVVIPIDAEEAEVLEIVRANEKLERFFADMDLVKVIYVKNKLVNLILKPR